VKDTKVWQKLADLSSLLEARSVFISYDCAQRKCIKRMGISPDRGSFLAQVVCEQIQDADHVCLVWLSWHCSREPVQPSSERAVIVCLLAGKDVIDTLTVFACK
jgi:hypothetical protein